MQKIRPLADRIVVEPKETESTTKGGIVIPKMGNEEKPVEGKVLAIGNGKVVDGKIQPLQVKIGDRILFGKYAGTSIKLDATEVLIMREEDVMGVLE